MGGRHIKWNLHRRSAYKMELTWEVGIHAKALCAVSPPAHCPNQLIHASRRLDKGINFVPDRFHQTFRIPGEKEHLTSEGAPGVTLASVDSKTWTSGTKHTWLYVALVDEPGEGNLVEKGDYSHSLSTQSALVTMGNRSCSSCRVSG